MLESSLAGAAAIGVGFAELAHARSLRRAQLPRANPLHGFRAAGHEAIRPEPPAVHSRVHGYQPSSCRPSSPAFESGLRVAGLGVAGLGVAGLGVAGLGVAGLGVAGLGVAGLGGVSGLTGACLRHAWLCRLSVRYR
ncbi:hypothetical protein FNF07_15890 [Trinickia caryophylli]|nr:hypothetical protein FNF07_15890 [Trinickia caryophylli]